MPEPQEAGQSQGTEQIQGAPAHSVQDKPTTTTSDPLMDALGIPKEFQAQITAADNAKEAKPAEAAPQPNADEQPPVTPEVTPESGLKPKEPSAADTAATTTAHKDEPDDDDDDDEIELAIPKGEEQQPQKPDKRQKRINRLTRKNSILEDENAQLRDRLSKLESAKGSNGEAEIQIPSASGRLAKITDERELNRVCAQSNAIIDWCNNNAGVTLDEKQLPDKIKAEYAAGNITLQEASAQTIAQWKDESQNNLLNAPTRREEIRAYNGDKKFFDDIAKQAWPDLFDKKSADYQLADAIEKEFPEIKGSVQRNYAIGLVIEGMRSLKTRSGKAQPNGARERRDIDPRVFEPRVPIAPTTPEPPTSEASAASSQTEVRDAMSALIKDPDGSAQSLAAVLAAEEKAAKRSGAAGARTPVRV